MNYSSDSMQKKDTPYAESPRSREELRQQKLLIFGAIVVGLLVLAGGVIAVSFLLQPNSPTETIRDIFIILLTFEFMLLGLALVILLIQLAKLINLLQNEIQPILESTSEAAHTLRGTASFLSRNLVGPVVKVNSTLAALRRAADLLNFGRRGKEN